MTQEQIQAVRELQELLLECKDEVNHSVEDEHVETGEQSL
jgi:hypothetical protein